MKSAAPSLVAATAFWIFAWPEIMITGTRGCSDLITAQQLDAVHLGHPYVEQNYCGTLARDQVNHARRVAGVNDAKAFVAQNSAQ